LCESSRFPKVVHFVKLESKKTMYKLKLELKKSLYHSFWIYSNVWLIWEKCLPIQCSSP